MCGAKLFVVLTTIILHVSLKKKLEKESKTRRKWSVKRPQRNWNFGRNNNDIREKK